MPGTHPHPHVVTTGEPSALVTYDDQIGLARRIEAGVYAQHLIRRGTDLGDVTAGELQAVIEDGERARRDFFLANLGLVRHIVMAWAQRHGAEADELFQEGCIGLGEAIQRFDPQRGCRFSTMAWPLIANRVAVAAHNRCGALDAPEWRLRTANRIRRRQELLEQRLGRRVTAVELAEDLGRPTQWVEAILSWAPPVSTDQVPEPDTEPLCGMTFDVTWLATLPRPQREVIIARYGLDGTPRSRARVAELLGILPSQARSLELQGLARLRQCLESAAA